MDSFCFGRCLACSDEIGVGHFSTMNLSMTLKTKRNRFSSSIDFWYDMMVMNSVLATLETDGIGHPINEFQTAKIE
jgi:hypothetical protein